MRTGTWISDKIGSLPINSSAKIILAEIDNLHKSKGCNAGNSHFAKILGVSTETVSRIISKLRKLGYVKQIHFDGRVRTLEPAFEIVFESKEKINSAQTIESNRIPQKGQSRNDALNNAAFAIQQNPLYIKEQYKEKIKEPLKFKDSKLINQNSFLKFLEWSKEKFSGSTKEVLLGLDSMDSLLKCENRTIQFAWENWK
ncbi:MAG: helix-turn-helix domain-containing protein [Leptospiraceae bacterium]|nr:helix-turn-helix domain-containing protein [Leptospiraceae bacterium]